MKKFLTLSAAIFCLAACHQSPRFSVEGTIDGAQDSILYLEAVTLEGVERLDSVRLNADGDFHLSAESRGSQYGSPGFSFSFL